MTYLEKKEVQYELMNHIINGLCRCEVSDNGWKFLIKVREQIIKDIANYE